MKVWILIAPILGIAAGLVATAAAAGSCARDKNCLDLPAALNFSSVPEISQRIVGEEQPEPAPLKNPVQDSAPYTGPVIGANPRPGRTPTVGYRWLLEK